MSRWAMIVMRDSISMPGRRPRLGEGNLYAIYVTSTLRIYSKGESARVVPNKASRTTWVTRVVKY